MRSRIREIRKSKKLRLSDVAARIKPTPTTAQTIGRLETGARSLTVEWINRIADALEVDPSELVTAPDQPDCPLVGVLIENGHIAHTPLEMIDLRLSAKDAIAVRIEAAITGYSVGDILICDRLGQEDFKDADGSDALVELENGDSIFGRILIEEDGKITLATPAPNTRVLRHLSIRSIAKTVMLLRHLD